MTHIKINENDFFNAIEIYEHWRDLNSIIQNHFSFKRKVNIPEAFTEVVCCYVNDFYLAITGGSEDAITESGQLIQIKATANWDRDLTSFGPTSNFDELHFVRLNQDTEELFLYQIPIIDLYDTQVSLTQTMKDQQMQGRRPRFSIVNSYIKRYNLDPYVIVDLKTRNIIDI